MSFTIEKLSDIWIHEIDLRPLNIDPRFLPTLSQFAKILCLADKERRILYFCIGSDRTDPREIEYLYIFAMGKSAYLITWQENRPLVRTHTEGGLRYISPSAQLKNYILEANAAYHDTSSRQLIIDKNGGTIPKG